MYLLKTKSNLSGFTLLELIIVMAVIGALSSIVFVTYPSTQKRARDAQRISDLRQYQSSLEVYYNANNAYPTSSNTLVSVCSSDLSTYTSACPGNPKGSWNYQYEALTGGYYIYSQLEQQDDSGNDRYQYFCSNGNSGETTTDPGGTNPC